MERRSSVLALPLSPRGPHSSISRGGFGATRAEVVRQPSTSQNAASFGEEDEDEPISEISTNESKVPPAKTSPRRRQSTASFTRVPLPPTIPEGGTLFRIPVFDQKWPPSSKTPLEAPSVDPHTRDRTQSVSFSPKLGISRSATQGAHTSHVSIKSSVKIQKDAIIKSRTKSVVLPAYIQDAHENLKKRRT